MLDSEYTLTQVKLISFQNKRVLFGDPFLQSFRILLVNMVRDI